MKSRTVQLVDTCYRQAIASELYRAANERGIRLTELEPEREAGSLEATKLAISSHSEGCMAVVSSPELNDTNMFAFVNFTKASCAAALPTGFYAIEVSEDDKPGCGQGSVARWVNDDGDTILTSPVLIENVLPVPRPNEGDLEVAYAHDTKVGLSTSSAVSRSASILAWIRVPPAGHKKATIVIH